MPKKCKNIANLLKPQNMKKYRIEITKNRIENSSTVKPKKAEIISINNHLTEITYQYCKGIRALKQNNKIHHILDWHRR